MDERRFTLPSRLRGASSPRERDAALAAGGAGVPRFLRAAATTELKAEPDADSTNDAPVPARPALSSGPLRVQRAPLEGAASVSQGHVGLEPAPEPDAADTTPVPGLVVEDDVEPGPGQLRRSELLARMRAEVCSAAEDSLSGTVWSSVGCPYIERWFDAYGGRSAEEVERALRRYLPEASGAASAGEYVSIAASRVRAAIGAWSGGDAEPSPEQPAAGGGLVAGLTRLLFKAADGGPRTDVSPAQVRAGLGAGEPLDSGIAGRFATGFGRSLPSVRVHRDAGAAAAAGRLNARAFTVGGHIAFGRGEYRPGTPIGDALIAHELAHVIQQDGAAGGESTGVAEDSRLEEEADRAAVAAVAGSRGAGGLLERLGLDGALFPRLRTGLRLSRCGADQAAEPESVHYDQAVGSCSSLPNSRLEGIAGLTHDQSPEADEIRANLTTLNAGGAYVFFGHGAYERSGGPAVGINPTEGSTIRGEGLRDALAADASPPTLVVLGACGSAALLPSVGEGGVPVAMGFSNEISNLSAASAVGIFMERLEAGDTFEEARQAAQDAASRLLGAEVVVRYGRGYNGGMTLDQARSRHRAEAAP